MNLLPASYDWYADYFLNEQDKPECQAVSKQLDNYKDGDGFYKITPVAMADLLLPLATKFYRYEPKSKVWYRFNGKYCETSEQLFTDVKDSLNDCKNRCGGALLSFRKNAFNIIHQAQFLPAVITCMQKSHQIHIDINDFDHDLDCANTPDGFYNLLSLTSDPNSIEHMCRQMTAVAPMDDEDGKNCPYYMAHLDYITQGRQDIIQWIEEISGYLLTGRTFAKEFYWFCGISDSGKSQLTIAWRDILGNILPHSYFIEASNTLFAHKYFEPHPEVWYRLIGKRMILTEELQDGKWNESLIKEFTSGNPMNGAKKFGDTVSFLPVGKLIFLSNKQPSMDGADSGMVTRLNLLDFTKQIPTDKRIPDFGTEVLFKQEGPYILNRMMKAAQRVLLRRKLSKPQAVQDSTKEYIQDNNLVELFFKDGCITGTDYSETWKNLHTACNLWCNENGYDCPSLKEFRNIVKTLSYKTGRNHAARTVLGITLNDLYKKKINIPVYTPYN